MKVIHWNGNENTYHEYIYQFDKMYCCPMHDPAPSYLSENPEKYLASLDLRDCYRTCSLQYHYLLLVLFCLHDSMCPCNNVKDVMYYLLVNIDNDHFCMNDYISCFSGTNSENEITFVWCLPYEMLVRSRAGNLVFVLQSCRT